MLVDEPQFFLVGLLRALDGAPGFGVPIFGRTSSNTTFVQEIGADGRIAGFREAAPSGAWEPYSTSAPVSPGARALWGFRDEVGGTLIADRETLTKHLRTRFDRLHDPFLRLQIVQFCEDAGALVTAWRATFKHLSSRSRKSAMAWRDVVVIPAQLRETIARVTSQTDIIDFSHDLSRSVQVEVDAGQLRLHLDGNLYAALRDNRHAREALESGAAPLREAFRLSAKPVELVDHAARYSEDPDQQLSGPTVIGIGPMAARVVLAAAPLLPRYGMDNAYREIQRTGNNLAVVVQAGAVGLHYLTDPGEPLDRLAAPGGTVFVVFPLSDQQDWLLKAALELARTRQRRSGESIIAVIPHFPRQFGHPGDLATEIVPELNRAFDALWVVSDRSPYARQALWYGPGHSAQAAATNLRYLLELASGNQDKLPRLFQSGVPNGLSVVARATGDRSAAKLAEHAIVRMACDVFDLASAKSANVRAGYWGSPDVSTVKQVVQRQAPHVRISVDANEIRHPGYADVLVALRGVEIAERGPSGFERYCVEQLGRHGWSFDQFVPDGAVHISKGVIEDLAVEFDYGNGASFETRPLPAAREHSDRVIITNASITRRSFATQVLKGAVPVHYSRLDALDRIWRRRFGYALSYLSKERGNAVALLASAGLAHLISRRFINLKSIGALTLAPGLVPNVWLGTDGVRLQLPLAITPRKGAIDVRQRGQAEVSFEKDGWHIHDVRIGDRHLRLPDARD